LTSIYAVWLGHNAVSRESIDKTYEFLFTKPKSRTWFLSRKVLTGCLYLTVYCLFNVFFSAASIAVLDIGEYKAFSLPPFQYLSGS
jgi:ABC-2 type transport system permease protein